MIGFIRRSTYMSMMGLSYQSYRSTQSMSGHLLQMTTHAEQSQSLSAQSTSDQTLANNLHQQSLTTQIEADELEQSASLLQKQAQEDQLQSIHDQTDASTYSDQVKAESSEAEALQAKIISEETLYESEIDKATSETTLASSDTFNTQSDTVATSFCEFIPFLDIVCDFVGGIAAVGFESNAAKLSAQSAMDYTSASALKTQEETDLSELDTLTVEIGETQEIVNGLETKAHQEEIKATAEETQAKEEIEEAAVEQSQAKEEELESESEDMKAKEEYTAAEEEMDKSVQEGLFALKDAIVSGIISTLVVSFFAIRVFVAIVIPGTAAVVSFVPYVMATTTTAAAATAAAPAFASSTNGNSGNVMGRIWTALPKRETSYFLLHCGLFISTMSLWFTSKFQKLEKYDVRSRGGILVVFALVASCLQAFLLHVLPYIIKNLKKLWNGHEEVVESAGASISSTPTIYVIIGRSILKFMIAILRLTPLFVIETITLWLIFGESVVSFHLPPPFTPTTVGIGIFIMAIMYVLVYELTTDEGEGDDNELVTVVASTKDVPLSLHSIVEEEEVDVVLIQQDNENDANFTNETRSLLSNDYNERRSYTHGYDVNMDERINHENDDSERLITGPSYNLISKIEIANEMQDIEFRASNENLDQAYVEPVESGCSISEGTHQQHHTIQVDEEISGTSTTTYQNRSTMNYESVSLILSSQQNSVTCQEVYSSDAATVSIVQSEVISETRAMDQQSNCSYWTQIKDTVEEYISDLKLPFEILIMTCMIVLLQGSLPILSQLLPRVVNSHKFFFLELGVVVLVIGVIVYYLVRMNDKHGHIGLWTGHSLR